MFSDIIPMVLGTAAGSKFGSWLQGRDKQPDIGEQITALVNQMNSTLSQYMDKAVAANRQGTNQAKKTIEDYYSGARIDLDKYLQQAKQYAAQNAWSGYQQAKAYNAPAIQAGNQALGAYMDTLGLSRPVAGYNAMQSALVGNADRQLMQSMLGGLGPKNPGEFSVVQDPGKAPTATHIGQADIQQFLTSRGPGAVRDYFNSKVGTGIASDLLDRGRNNAARDSLIGEYLQQLQDQGNFRGTNLKKLDVYNQQKAAYDQYQANVAAKQQYDQYQGMLQQQMNNIPVDQGMLNLIRSGRLQ